VILDARQIRKSYGSGPSELHILKGIDLSLEEGQMMTIVGPSGAGKSTLLHILGGLDAPTAGTVNFDGEDLYGLNDTKRSKVRNEKVGFIFQFYHLLPEFSALENVCLPLLVKEDQLDIRKFEPAATELLTTVGLKERLRHKPNQLSGGEQQRVAIARALIAKPKIIFCDEPTGNLDTETGRTIIDLLVKLNREHQQTLVIVTHDESLARQAGRRVHMRDGKIM